MNFPYIQHHDAQVPSRESWSMKVGKMREADVAKPAKTKSASPNVYLTKKDGWVRFCVDCRRFNAVIERDSYTIPERDECIALLSMAQMLSTIDTNSEYWQIETNGKNVCKTAFVTHHELFKYTRMIFGLKNSPATLWCPMDVILALVKWQNALVYIDDIIFFSKTPEEQLKHNMKCYIYRWRQRSQRNWRSVTFAIELLTT